MEITTDQLWVMLGQLYAENKMLQAENTQLRKIIMKNLEPPEGGK